MDIDLSPAVDAIWFCTCKNTRTDVASEVQPRLDKVGIIKINSGNEVHSNEVHKCASFSNFFPSFPILNSTSCGMETIPMLRFPMLALHFHNDTREEL